MTTIDCLLGRYETSEMEKVGKVSETRRRKGLDKFRAALGALAIVVLLSYVISPPAGYAAFPGANGKIAFDSNRDGREEIYVMNATAAGRRT